MSEIEGAEALHWVLIERGCVECGEDDQLISVHHSEAAAHSAMAIAAEDLRRMPTRLVVLSEKGRR